MIHAWDVATIWPLMGSFHTNCSCIVSFSGHQGDVTSLTSTADGEFLFSGGRDHSIRMWNTRSGRCVRHIEDIHSPAGHHRGTITGLYCLQDDQYLLSASLDGCVKMYHIMTVMEKESKSLSIDDLLAGFMDNGCEWEVPEEGGDELLSSQALMDSEGILSFILNKDGTKIGVCSTEANLRVYDINSNSELTLSLACQIRSHTAIVSCITTNTHSDIVSASHDHHMLITDSITHCLLWDQCMPFSVNVVIALYDVILVAGYDYSVHIMKALDPSFVFMECLTH